MAKKMAELKNAQSAYRRHLQEAMDLRARGDIPQAIKAAKEAWPYINEMMQFEQKSEDREFESVEALDLVLQYAPAIFDKESLDELETLLNDQRRIKRNTKADWVYSLSKARKLMRVACRLRNYLES